MCCAHSVCAMVWLYAPTRISLLKTCSRAENFCCRQISLTTSPGVALNLNPDPNMTSGSEPLKPPPTQGLQPKGCLFSISLSRRASWPLPHAWSPILSSLWVSVLPHLFLLSCVSSFLLPVSVHLSSSSFSLSISHPLSLSLQKNILCMCACVCISMYYCQA